MFLFSVISTTGGEAERIVLWPLGGYVLLGRTEGVTVWEDFWVALAGPLTHIPMVAFWFGIYLIFEPWREYQFDADASWDFDELSEWDGFLATIAEQAMFLNAGLFVFNVFVPAYPLDGGRILAALLVLCCCCSVQCAAYTTSLTALALAAGMAAWAVYDMFWDDSDDDNSNADDANGGAPILLLLIALWIALNSFGLLFKAWQGKAVEHALFSKECYRRRAGVHDDDNDRGSFGQAPPPSSSLGGADATSSSSLSRKELRQQQREAKRQAKEAQKQAKQQAKNKKSSKDDDDNDGMGEEPSTEPPTPASATFYEPQPIDVDLSPAGTGPSWTTFNTTAPAPAPPPDLEDVSEKRGSGFGRLFGKKKRAMDDDIVV